MWQQHRPGSGAAATAAFGLAGTGLYWKACSDARRLAGLRSLRRLPIAVLVGALAACGSNSTAPSGDTVANIVISPDSISLASGSSQTLAAHARTGSGASVPTASFFWSTSDSLVATVDQSGNVVAHEPGAAQIGASADGMSGLARVIVVEPLVKTVVVSPASDTIYASPPGDSAKLSAAGYDGAGHVIPGSSVLWSISSPLATVTSGTVVGTNTNAGTVIVTATSPDSGNASGTASVLVIGHVATTSVSPQYALLSSSGTFLSKTVQLSDSLVDTFKHVVTGQRVVTWSTGNPAVATVNSHGLVTAVSKTDAETEITATTSDGSSGTMSVEVFP